MDTAIKRQLQALGCELHIDLMTFGHLEDERLFLREENRDFLREHGYRWSISLGSRLLESYCELLLPHTDEGFMAYFHAYTTKVAERLDHAAHRLCETLEDAGYRAFLMPGRGKGYPKGEPGIISHMALARLSGMGSMGNSGMLLTPQFGPRVRLATILTSCPLADTMHPLENDVCINCGKCGESCPSKCIHGNRFDASRPQVQYIDKELCGQYRNQRMEAIGTRFCNMCMAVCPVGKRLK